MKGLVSPNDVDAYDNEKRSNYWVGRRIREALIERDGGECIWCGHSVTVHRKTEIHRTATIEHLVPRAFGGTCGGVFLLNLAIACKECNHARGCEPCAYKVEKDVSEE